MKIKTYLKFFAPSLGLRLLIEMVAPQAPIIYWVLTAPSCDEESEAVAYARSLSEERLARLYKDMELYSQSKDTPRIGYAPKQENSDVPEAFADLDVVRVKPSWGVIVVQGCFDHGVYLYFRGIGISKDHKGKKQIAVGWGEVPPHSGTEVLWTEEPEKVVE